MYKIVNIPDNVPNAKQITATFGEGAFMVSRTRRVYTKIGEKDGVKLLVNVDHRLHASVKGIKLVADIRFAQFGGTPETFPKLSAGRADRDGAAIRLAHKEVFICGTPLFGGGLVYNSNAVDFIAKTAEENGVEASLARINMLVKLSLGKVSSDNVKEDTDIGSVASMLVTSAITSAADWWTNGPVVATSEVKLAAVEDPEEDDVEPDEADEEDGDLYDEDEDDSQA